MILAQNRNGRFSGNKLSRRRHPHPVDIFNTAQIVKRFGGLNRDRNPEAASGTVFKVSKNFFPSLSSRLPAPRIKNNLGLSVSLNKAISFAARSKCKYALLGTVAKAVVVKLFCNTCG